MAKFSIKVDKKTGQTYLPRDIRNEGFTGEVDGLANAVTVTLIKPGAKLSAVQKSLEIILDDVSLRLRLEEEIIMEEENNKVAGRLHVRHDQATEPRHPLFHKYTRDWLFGVTGYSKGYLSRVATGKIPLSRSFVERVCFKLGEPESELFVPDADGESN